MQAEASEASVTTLSSRNAQTMRALAALLWWWPCASATPPVPLADSRAPNTAVTADRRSTDGERSWEALCASSRAMPAERHEYVEGLVNLTRIGTIVKRDLEARGVLCDTEDTCQVRALLSVRQLEVCVSARALRVCDPNSDARQRAGGVASRCYNFNADRLNSWAAKAKQRPRYVFDLGAAPHAKPGLPSSGRDEVKALARLLNSSRSTFTMRRFGRCAFVGSGHDLGCRSQGQEIDGAEAVFRANGGQQFDNPYVDKISPRGVYVDASIAGRRTDARVFCLHDSKVLESSKHEVCILTPRWWKQAWARESTNNTPHLCCAEQIRSSYSIRSLLHAAAQGANFAWSNPTYARDEDLDRPLLGSGGAALYLAIAQCDHVDVYGSGLYSAKVAEHKVYLHFYDDILRTQCEALPKGSKGFESLAQHRIANEVLMHIMHALGIITWHQ